MRLKTDIEICPPNKCTGCSACINACSSHCIILREDDFGELHPFVDTSKCLNCGQCIRACPNNNKLIFHFPSVCYASWITNKEKRAICASGGIGSIIAEYVIRYKHGIVVGTAYDEDLIPRTICVESFSQIDSLKGSKYVQSIVGVDLLVKIKRLLIEGRFVAYIGTPCQIAGLKTFLNRDYNNLLTVDLICHGVCPTVYFKSEVEAIKKKLKLDVITDVRFRGNDVYDYKFTLRDKILHPQNHTNFCLSVWQESNAKPELIFSQDVLHSPYLKAFLAGITLRESCYTCSYARPERVADITIGDFIGLGKNKPFEFDRENVSVVTLNNAKGKLFYQELSSMMLELVNVQRDYDERLEYKPSLVHPFLRHKLNAKFRCLYKKKGYNEAIRKTLYWPMTLSRIQAILHRIVYFPYDVVTKMQRVIKAGNIRA